MKTIILILLSFSFLSPVEAQEREKDTLFFNIDKYYTISPTITSNLWLNTTWLEKEQMKKQQMTYTKTNGYIFFVGDGYMIKGLKPKKILSIKDYIENKKFYLDGKYNEIVDKWKLQDSLTDKYIIYFVNGDEFIHPRALEYNFYYPVREGDNFIKNKVKDTLFFKLDNDYVYEDKNSSNEYFLKEKSTEGGFLFKEIKKTKDLKQKEVLDLKKFIQSSRMFNENNKLFDTDELYKYLNNYIVFLVKENKKETEYIQVYSSYSIE